MSSLTENQLSDVSKQLASERHQILEQIHDHIREADDTDLYDRYVQMKDPGDYSVADMLADMRLEQMDRETEQLRAIESAERRLITGDYGECIECGTEIQAERLLAQPTAARCLQCQEKYEREHVTRTSNSF